jgi:hypothetical protein
LKTNSDCHVSKLSFILLCVSLFFIFILPHQISAQDKTANKKVFGPEAIWAPSETVIQNIGKSCENGGDCFISKMIEAGASPSSVKFTKTLIKKDFPFCFMKFYKEMGQVDQVMVDCPFMANTMGFTLLVNGKPSIFLPGDSKYLDKIDLRKDPKYSTIIKKYPRAELWLEGNLEKVVKSADGGQRFIWRHRILNGCRACEIAGTVTVAYDFDRNGKYKGVHLLELSEEDLCQ